MEKPILTPICCSNPCRWIVHSVTLAYFFCDTCKKEPVNEIKAREESFDKEMEEIVNLFTGFNTVAVTNGHTIDLSDPKNPKCTVCGMQPVTLFSNCPVPVATGTSVPASSGQGIVRGMSTTVSNPTRKHHWTADIVSGFYTCKHCKLTTNTITGISPTCPGSTTP